MVSAMEAWIVFLFLTLNLILSGCAYLGKTSSVGLKDRANIENNCKDESRSNQFFIPLQKGKSLVTIESADEVTWIGPLVLPLIPLYDGSGTIYGLWHRSSC